MKKTLFAFALLAFTLPMSVAQPEEPEERNFLRGGTTAAVKIKETVEVTKREEPVFRNVIRNFSVKSGRSNPPSAIVSGVVVDDNAGAPREFEPIFFGSTFHLPRLAALTSVEGRFSFRVRLIENPKWYNRLGMEYKNEASLYLGGQFNEKAEMRSSTTDIYLIGDLLRKAFDSKEHLTQ